MSRDGRESLPRGNQESGASKPIHFEKPASAGQPERYAAVRRRADEALKRLDYAKRLQNGEVSFSEAMGKIRRRLEARKKPPRSGVSIDHDLLKGLHERLRAFKFAQNKAAREQASLSIPSFTYNFLRERRVEALMALSHKSVALIDPNMDETLQKFSQDIPVTLTDGTQQDQLKFARTIVEQYGLKEDAGTVRVVLLQMKRDEADAALLATQLQRESTMAVLSRAAVETDDPEKAFAQALKASPELRRDYEQYLEVWKSENLADVFGSPVPEVKGADVGQPSADQASSAVEMAQAQGVTLHLSAGHVGEAHFGQLVRDIAVYNVDGQPKVFVYDRNADRGVIGPVEPIGMRRVMAELVVDEYFSDHFRKIATASTEVDPTKVEDATLLKIVHALLPRTEGKMNTEVDISEQRTLDIVAELFVTPDKKYASLASRVEFLSRLVADPERAAKARLAIEHVDLSAREGPFSLSAFETLLEEDAPALKDR